MYFPKLFPEVYDVEELPQYNKGEKKEDVLKSE